MRRVVLVLASAGLVIGLLALPAEASATAPSKPRLAFKVPFTVTSFDPFFVVIPLVASWTQGKSATPGVSCCTNIVYQWDGDYPPAPSDLYFFTVTKSAQVTDVRDGGVYWVDSYDANGAFVGSTPVPACPQVCFGAVVIIGPYANDPSSYALTGSWSNRADSGAMFGSVLYSGNAKSSASVTESHFAWITTTGPTHGSAAIYVNGVYVKTVSTYSAKIRENRVLYQHSAYATITIQPVGNGEVDLTAEASWSYD